MTASLIGKRIGNYDIQAKLGEGGMGVVYLGIHPQIGKRVAVKVLHEELSSKSDVVSRFFTEARSVNDINHPNIVDIVDFGEISLDGVMWKYIIMEFLDGESLSSRIRREGVTIRETLHIIEQCASALAASHKKGVVHRDLKPENIYLCPRGTDKNYVKLLDFGIAKLTGDGGGAMSSRTRTGMVIGTPAYMSPEQCEGKGLIDHRSDIYALGVVMYELLTGRVPFPGDGFGEVLVAHLTREPEPATQLNANIPVEVEAIVMRCLKKPKDQRFQSMDELGAALQDPATYYQQQGGGTAQLPFGAVAASPLMSTVMSGAQPLQARPSAVPVGSAPVQLGSQLLDMSGPKVVHGQPPVTGFAQRPSSAQLGPVSDPLAAASSGARATSGTGQGISPTLSGASGEAAGPGRRPVSVLLGLGGAALCGVLVALIIKMPLRHPAGANPGKGGVSTAPGAAQDLVSVVVKTTPPEADLLRGDRIDAPPERTPYTLKLKRGSTLDIKLHLDGYREETRSISADRDKVIEVSLVKHSGGTVAAAGDEDKGRKEKKSRSRRERRKKKDDGVLTPIF